MTSTSTSNYDRMNELFSTDRTLDEETYGLLAAYLEDADNGLLDDVDLGNQLEALGLIA